MLRGLLIGRRRASMRRPGVRVMDAFAAEGIVPPAILVRNTAAPGKAAAAITVLQSS